MSKPIVTLNLGKLFTGSTTRNADELIEDLQRDGYHVALIDHVQAPTISIESPTAPDRRERIATALLAAMVANGGRTVSGMLDASVKLTDLFVKELDK